MSYAFCVVPVAPVRTKPAHDAEMSSQLLFGEHVEWLSAPVNGFVEIRCSHDSYTGFCAVNQLLETSSTFDPNTNMASEWINNIQHGDHLIRIPFGASLPEALKAHFDYSTVSIRPFVDFKEDLLLKRIDPFLNTPYLWGGRSVFGIDCSGFAQAIAKQFGKYLPRDAWQQAEVGELVEFGSHKPGDLAFFELNDKVVHVGVITAEKEITHAFGKIRIDSFINEGILNKDTGIITHALHSIRRVF